MAISGHFGQKPYEITIRFTRFATLLFSGGKVSFLTLFRLNLQHEHVPRRVNGFSAYDLLKSAKNGTFR